MRLSDAYFKIACLILASFLNCKADEAAISDSCSTMHADRKEVCLSIGIMQFTLNRLDGEISIYGTLEASDAVNAPVRVTVVVSSPMNPSGVKLEEGSTTQHREYFVDRSHAVKEALLFKVKTSKDNATSGKLRYFVNLRSADETIEATGPQQEVQVDTSP